MNELNVGDYVRTKQKGLQPPQIAKIKSMKRDEGYNNQYYIELDHNLLPDYEYHIYEEDVAKTSPDIIDLIEVGDYVNGYKVIEVVRGFKVIIDKLEIDTTTGLYHNIGITKIKTVVTKEQFENISYKVGE